MKKTLLYGMVAVVAMVGIAGCYKEKQPIDPRVVLPRHKWHLIEQDVSTSKPDPDCVLATVLTFKKDSTGLYYNPTPCNGVDTNVRFHWTISADKKYIYQTLDSNQNNGKPRISWSIGLISDDSLRIGAITGGTNRIEIYTSN